MDKVNKVVVLKDLVSNKILKQTSVGFSIFTDEVLELTKEVDKPEDYYYDLDEISFTIKVLNKGLKNISGFALKDELESYIKPISNDEFNVTTTHGIVKQDGNIITVEDISLASNETVTVKITGIISMYNEVLESSNLNEDNSDNTIVGEKVDNIQIEDNTNELEVETSIDNFQGN